MEKDFSKTVEKRKATIEKKRAKKAEKKLTYQEKIIEKHQEHLTELKDVSNKNAYAKILNRFNKFKNKRIIKTGARYKGKDVIEVIVHEKMKKEEILKYVNTLSKDLGRLDKTGFLDLSVRGNQWLFGGQTQWGKNVVFNDEYDQINEDEFSSFAVYFSALPENFGGATDHYNNCLYDCLLEVLGSRLLKIWATPTDLKKFLKLPYDAKISIKDLEKIEKKINCNISCSGDYCYTSPYNNLKQINLQLINEHYSLLEKQNDELKTFIKNKISHRERKLIIYNKQLDPESGKYFMCYDGEKSFQLTKEFRHEIYNWKTNYMLVSIIHPKKSLKENYEEFIMIANELKDKTNGRINLYKTGDFTNTAIDLFNSMIKHIPNPDPIRQIEAEALNNASQGAIVFTTKGYQGQVYKADVKSMYPSIMCQSTMLFPIKEGEWLTLPNTPTQSFYRYGIYRAIIEKSDDNNVNKLFRFNYDNHYTHIDLTRAKEINLKIELIEDGQPNYLSYTRDKCLTGSELFGEFVNLLFPMKNNNVKGSKNILNDLWGKLCQRDLKKCVHKHGESYDIPDDARPIFKPYDDSNTIITYVKYNKQNKLSWARIKPFLLAKGRATISKLMEANKDILVRCHTDGVMFSRMPQNIEFGEGLGDFRYEGLHDILINQSGLVYELHDGKYKLMNTIGTDHEVLIKDK